jgi:hypothetical protein
MIFIFIFLLVVSPISSSKTNDDLNCKSSDNDLIRWAQNLPVLVQQDDDGEDFKYLLYLLLNFAQSTKRAVY